MHVHKRDTIWQQQLCLQCIVKYTHFSSVCSRNTQSTFQSSDKRLKVFKLPQKPFVHLWPTPRVSSNIKDWMFFSMQRMKKKKKKWRWYLSGAIIMKSYPVLTRSGGRDELELEGSELLTAHSSRYLSDILLPHFNSHSSLKSPIRCRSHFLWFVF